MVKIGNLDVIIKEKLVCRLQHPCIGLVQISMGFVRLFKYLCQTDKENKNTQIANVILCILSRYCTLC